MKVYLKHILVVEGKEDVSYLSNYIGSEIVATNGYELDKSLLDYLKNKTVIALFDPDEAGLKIREIFNKQHFETINVEINIEKCSRGFKNGVAECSIDEIMEKLSPYIISNNEINRSISNDDLHNLGLLNNKNLRNYVCNKLHLGKCNNKQLLNRLMYTNIDLDTLKETIAGYDHGN